MDISLHPPHIKAIHFYAFLDTRLTLQETLSAYLGAWCDFMSRRVSLVGLADAASKSRSKRIASEVLNVWHAYTIAMRADLDPSSPFLSPRSPQADRQLIRHVAASLGGGDRVSPGGGGVTGM